MMMVRQLAYHVGLKMLPATHQDSGVVLCDTWNWSDDNDTVSGIEYRDTIAIPEPEMD